MLEKQKTESMVCLPVDGQRKDTVQMLAEIGRFDAAGHKLDEAALLLEFVAIVLTLLAFMGVAYFVGVARGTAKTVAENTVNEELKKFFALIQNKNPNIFNDASTSSLTNNSPSVNYNSVREVSPSEEFNGNGNSDDS